MRSLLRAALMTMILVLGSAAAVQAAPTKNAPTGSGRVLFFTATVDDSYTLPAGTACPFPVLDSEQGWIQLRVKIDASGIATADAEHDHIVYTDEAFGVSVTDPFYTTRFDTGEDSVVLSSDGTTYTYTARRVGRISKSAEGKTIGNFSFTLLIDATTGEELDFVITRAAGHADGAWANWPDSVWCDQFTAKA